jgi:hypothetical protein
MRSFSKEEEAYLVAITECCTSKDWHNLKFGNLILKILCRSINFNCPLGFEIKTGESGLEDDVEEYSKAITDGYIPIATFCSLIEYLHRNQLISLIPLFENNDFGSEGIGKDRIKDLFQITDPKILRFLKINRYKVVYPSQELFDLVENDFKTIEQIRFEKELSLANKHHAKAMRSAKKQLCFARLAFIVSVITLFITLGYNYYGIVNIKSPKIEEQLNQIKIEILDQKQPKVINTNITNDTLKVFLLKPKKRH